MSAASRGLVALSVSVPPREVVFFKSIVEASEGVASIFAEAGGDLTLATPAARLPALLELLDDLTVASIAVSDAAADAAPSQPGGGLDG
ncbi:MAG: DUF4911 domain-containing protein [Polyangiaceae bacterium]